MIVDPASSNKIGANAKVEKRVFTVIIISATTNLRPDYVNLMKSHHQGGSVATFW